jgi:hypothetical protein
VQRSLSELRNELLHSRSAQVHPAAVWEPRTEVLFVFAIESQLGFDVGLISDTQTQPFGRDQRHAAFPLDFAIGFGQIKLPF